MTDEIKIKRYAKGEIFEQSDLIIKEHRLNIFVNGEHYISLMCLPQNIEELAVGFLFSEGLISSYADVLKIESPDINNIFVTLDGAADNIKADKRVIVSGFGRGSVGLPFLNFENLPMISSPLKTSPGEIIKMMALFNKQSDLFQKTGAVHSCSLMLPDGTSLFYEDIGRHNAVDKIIGRVLIAGLCKKDAILLTSGRISCEMLIKTAGLGIPILVSTSAPTNMAVEIAEKMSMTLIGFARDERFNIYSGDFRVT